MDPAIQHIDGLTFAETIRLLRDAEEAQIQDARINVNSFIEYVGIDDKRKRRLSDGTYIPIHLIQSPIHIRMQQLMDEHDRLVLMTHPQIGKTTQIVLRMVWLIGRNPDIRIRIVSKSMDSEGTGALIARQIRNYIQNSAEVKRVFPHLHPGPKWEQHKFQVRRSSYSKEPTVAITSAGRSITGRRIDICVVDDLYDDTNTRTESDRKKLEKWFFGALIERFDDNTRLLMVCNPWHPRDLAHTIERRQLKDPANSRWKVFRFPVYTPTWERDLSKVQITLPALWPVERIRQVQSDMIPTEFARAFLCKPSDDSESPFDQAQVINAFRNPDGVDGGNGRATIRELPLSRQRELGCYVTIGVDLGVSEKATADQTVLTVCVVWPEQQVYQVIWIEGGRWRAEDIGERILELDRRFRPVMIMVEDNAAQKYMISIVALVVQLRRAKTEQAVPMPPVVPFTTTRQKWHPVRGVEGISVEISGGRWLFPTIYEDGSGDCHKDLVSLQEDIIGYSRGPHTGDHLMSLWLAREGCRAVMYADDDELQERMDEMENVESDYGLEESTMLPSRN